jgi:hypothetical protein
MIVNISNKVNAAFSKSCNWNQEKFLHRLNKVKSLIPGSTVDWDEYAGENWGIVSVLDKPVIYINRSYPIVLIQEKLKDFGLPIDDLEVVIFSEPDVEAFCLDSSLFEEWSKGRSKTGGLNNKSLSASDIWWATVL